MARKQSRLCWDDVADIWSGNLAGWGAFKSGLCETIELAGEGIKEGELATFIMDSDGKAFTLIYVWHSDDEDAVTVKKRVRLAEIPRGFGHEIVFRCPVCEREIGGDQHAVRAQFLYCLGDMLGIDLRPVREEGQRRIGTTRNCRKQTSMTPPRSATCFAWAIVRPGTLVNAWLTRMFLTPSSRPRFTTAMISSGEHQVLARDDLQDCFHLWRDLAVGSTIRPTASGLDKVFTCLSASNVGSQTILPRPP